MKHRFVWRYQIVYSDDQRWDGYCPVWASASLPSDGRLVRERVLAVGTSQPCNYCTGSHIPVPAR